jgi:hypothetical protein
MDGATLGTNSQPLWAGQQQKPCLVKEGLLCPPHPTLFFNGNEEGEEGVGNVAFEPPFQPSLMNYP